MTGALSVPLSTWLLGCSGLDSAEDGRTIAPEARRLTLGAYTTPREAYGRAILPAFAEKWRQEHGEEVTFEESYQASGAQARAVIEGFEADVVALSLEPDIATLEARFVGDVNVFRGVVRGGVPWVGPLAAPADDLPPGLADGQQVNVIIRAYDLKFWADADGCARARRVMPLGDRVRIEAELDGGELIHAQFPRRSSLLHGITPGERIAVEITRARSWPVLG